MDDIVFPEELWAGTEISLDVARQVYAQLMADVSAAMRAGSVIDPIQREAPVPYKFSLHGNIGVISIRGSLVNNDSPWLRYYEGVTSYGAIREALVYATTRSEVKGILLDIESGGGAVSGVEDVATLIAQVGKVKPVWAFSGGNMASAAYWMGSSAKKVYGSKIALMGSIGVTSTHIEYSKQMKENGVGATVFRSGEFKALVTPYEPLTEAARKQIQNQIDRVYDVFIEQVADSRGVSKAVADQKMGQGREFVGEESVAAGLADGVMSFDKVMSRFAASLDRDSGSLQNVTQLQKRNDMTRAALTDQQMAALASGATIEAAVAAPAVAAAPAVETPVVAAPVVVAAAAAAAAAPADVVAMLQNQVVAKDADLLKANVELAQLRERMASQETHMSALTSIAVGSIRTMRVALFQSVPDLSKAGPEQVVVEHTAAKAAFETRFKPGGVASCAAVNTAAEAEVAAKNKAKGRAGVNALDRVQATRFHQPSNAK